MDRQIQMAAIEFERRISNLLKTSKPSELKAFQLYKRSQQEEFFNGSFDSFRSLIQAFYDLDFDRRNPTALERIFKNRITNSFYNEFLLHFGSSYFSAKDLLELKEWCLQSMSSFSHIPGAIKHHTIIYRAFGSLLNQSARHRAFSVEWTDFVDSWERECFKRWGETHRDIFEYIRSIAVDQAWNENESSALEIGSKSQQTLQVTQTELNWINDLILSIDRKTQLPSYPLQRGPKNIQLIELNNLVRTQQNQDESADNSTLLKILDLIHQLLRL